MNIIATTKKVDQSVVTNVIADDVQSTVITVPENESKDDVSNCFEDNVPFKD